MLIDNHIIGLDLIEMPAYKCDIAVYVTEGESQAMSNNPR